MYLSICLVYLSICLSIYLSIYLWQHQGRTTSARLPPKMEDQCCAHILVPIRFAIFLLHLSKVLRQPRKQAARSSELLHIMQNHLSNPTLMMLQNERNQRPDFPTSLIIFPQTYLLLFANHAPNIRARITRNLKTSNTTSVLLSIPHIQNWNKRKHRESRQGSGHVISQKHRAQTKTFRTWKKIENANDRHIALRIFCLADGSNILFKLGYASLPSSNG